MKCETKRDRGRTFEGSRSVVVGAGLGGEPPVPFLLGTSTHVAGERGAATLK